METGKRRSRVLLKAVQGGSNHRRLELSEESEMSDCSCSNSPVPHSLKQHDPSDLPRPLKQYISSESLPSAHAHHSPSRQPRLHSSSKSLHSVSDAAPRPPANTLSSTKPHPLGWPSSQSHPDPNIISPAPLMSPCLLTQLSTKSAPTSPSDSRHSLCISEPEGAVVCDIATNMPSCAVSSKTAAGRDVNSQAKVEKRNEVTVRSKGVRRSLSQPTLTVPSIALPAKSRGKRHIFVSPMLSVMNGSTDSLPTLKYSVVQPCDREPPSPKPARPSKHHSKASKRQVHPEERTASKFSEDHIRLFQSPSSSESSTARRKPSLTESARSSAVSLTLGPLLTAGLRIGKTKSMAEGRWENAEEAQLESCFPDRHIRLSVVTWNMNERKELPGSLEDLLLPLHQNVAADMFVVGTQESSTSRKDWEVLIQKTLGPYYVLVQSSSIGVIYLSLFIRRDLIWFCSATSSASFATRPVTIIRTKGAVGLSFTLFGSSFLFITSHFTAGMHKVLERNADMQRIAANLSLREDATPNIAGSSRDVTNEFDYVFWFGDLNYRVDMDRQTANKCLVRSDIMSLLLKDQLTREMLQLHTFPGFSEQPIAFPPTYKFDLFTNRYDSSEKQRVPSWTDRILFKSRTGDGISGCGYASCKTLKCSDHKPVCGIFRVKLEPSHSMEGISGSIASFDREVYLRANKQRSTILAMAKATEQVDGRQRDATGRRPVASQFCTIL